MDYEDILNYIENIVEEIEFEEISIPEIKEKLQELIEVIEDNRGIREREIEDYDFDWSHYMYGKCLWHFVINRFYFK